MNSGRRLVYVTVALGAAVVLSGLACGALWLLRWQGRLDTGATATPPPVTQTVRQWPAAEAKQALTATSACVLRLHSVDSAGFDQDVRGVLDCSGGDLRKEVLDNETALRQALGDSTSITAKVVDSAIVRFGDGRGRFLFSIDSTTRRAGSEAQTKHFRVIADSTEVDGRFLLTGLRFAG